MAGTETAPATNKPPSSSMEMNPPPPPVRIITVDSPDPAREAKYDLICHSHSVHVVVTSTPEIVRRWISLTRFHRGNQIGKGRLLVGLGVQRTPRRAAATIQLCVGPHCLIFQLLHAADSPAALRRFLTDPKITLVGLGNFGDVLQLSYSNHRLLVPRLVDLRPLANSYRGCNVNASMETLASEILGMEGMVKDEAVGRSDWELKPLSEEQVMYASLDAFLSHLIGKNLGAWKYQHYNVEDQDALL